MFATKKATINWKQLEIVNARGSKYYAKLCTLAL